MIRTLLTLTCAAAFSLLALGSTAVAAPKDFHDQNLPDKVFSNGILNGADFSDAVLKNAKFDHASLKRANFKGADLQGAWLTDADITDADLTDVKGSPLCSHSHFDRAKMQRMNLKSNDCTFKGADLREATIAGYIYGCDFSGADLRGANLRAMTVPPKGQAENRWKGVIYDDDTAWPDGFDPVAEGAVLSKDKDK
ncbi:MAG TPA: pentapeptide repeat-containing protein [Chthoniobacter sp.]|nr:pentapeptide repeat-containing protein [Chthoniobacter sp.]